MTVSLKLVCLVGIVIGIGIVWFYFQPVRVQIFRLPQAVVGRWVAIEFNRADCSPLYDGLLAREIIIPESGYVCSSSQMETGWTYDLFLLEAGDDWLRLDPTEQIIARGATQMNFPNCRILAETFWVRLEEDQKVENKQASFIEIHHPECFRGITTETNE